MEGREEEMGSRRRPFRIMQEMLCIPRTERTSTEANFCMNSAATE
jgi:hypothetical protein